MVRWVARRRQAFFTVGTARQANNWAWLCRPQVRETYADAPTPSLYSPGRVGPALTDMSAYIVTTQNAIVTANSSLARLTQTVIANGVAITTTAQALSTTSGKANTALARAGVRSGVRLDVNGYATGWEAPNNGQSGSIIVNADLFSIRKTGSGACCDFINGHIIATDGSTWMPVYGAPFGPGNRFVEWTGPYLADLNNCSEANAENTRASTAIRISAGRWWQCRCETHRPLAVLLPRLRQRQVHVVRTAARSSSTHCGPINTRPRAPIQRHCLGGMTIMPQSTHFSQHRRPMADFPTKVRRPTL